jgi:hypothetical protein
MKHGVSPWSDNIFIKYPHGAQTSSFQPLRAQEHRTMWYGKYWSKFCLPIRLVPAATRNQVPGLLTGRKNRTKWRLRLSAYFSPKRNWIRYFAVYTDQSGEFMFSSYGFNTEIEFHNLKKMVHRKTH